MVCMNKKVRSAVEKKQQALTTSHNFSHLPDISDDLISAHDQLANFDFEQSLIRLH